MYQFAVNIVRTNSQQIDPLFTANQSDSTCYPGLSETKVKSARKAYTQTKCDVSVFKPGAFLGLYVTYPGGMSILHRQKQATNHPLTCLAGCSSISGWTGAFEPIDLVCTGSTIHAWIASTLIDIYDKRILFLIFSHIDFLRELI